MLPRAALSQSISANQKSLREPPEKGMNGEMVEKEKGNPKGFRDSPGRRSLSQVMVKPSRKTCLAHHQEL